LRYRPETTLEQVFREIDVAYRDGVEKWWVSISPNPRHETNSRSSAATRGRKAKDLLSYNLVEIGVVFGSVLVLEYEQKNPGVAFV
jgi:hypothetical protein